MSLSLATEMPLVQLPTINVTLFLQVTSIGLKEIRQLVKNKPRVKKIDAYFI